MRKFFFLLLAALAVTLPAAADVEWEFIIPDEGAWVYEAHYASIYTPVTFPMNAVYRKRSTAYAQEETQELLAEIRPEAVVRPVAFEGSGPETPELVLEGELPPGDIELVER